MFSIIFIIDHSTITTSEAIDSLLPLLRIVRCISTRRLEDHEFQNINENYRSMEITITFVWFLHPGRFFYATIVSDGSV